MVKALWLWGCPVKDKPEYVDQGPLRFRCKVHVVLLVVIGNSWLLDKHWYENK